MRRGSRVSGKEGSGGGEMEKGASRRPSSASRRQSLGQHGSSLAPPPGPMAGGSRRGSQLPQHLSWEEDDDDRRLERKKRRMKAYCFDFSQHTTSHGIYWIGDAKSKRRRAFWVTAFFICAFVFFIQAIMMVSRFLRYDTIVNIELKFETAVFPAVTVCNLNPFKYSLVQGVDSIKRTLTSYTKAMGKSSGDHKSPPKAKKGGLSVKKASARIRRQKDPYEEFLKPGTTEAPEYAEPGSIDLFRFKAVRVDCRCPVDARSECTPQLPPAYEDEPDDRSPVQDSIFSALRSRRRRARLRRQQKEVPTLATSCVCFYDSERAVVWPCYAQAAWGPASCPHCSFSGTCLQPTPGPPTEGPASPPLSDPAKDATLINYLTAYTSPLGQGGTPCYCQNVSNVCVGHPEGRDPYELWEARRTTTTPPPPPPTESEEAVNFEKAQGFENMTDEVAITTRAKENLIYTTANLPSDLQEELSYEKHELLRMCSFNGQQCDIERDFRLHSDPVYGNCYTFNYLMNSTLTTTRAGPFYGLRLMVYVNATDYLPTTEALGVRMAVHGQREFPFPDTFGFSAPTGFISSFGISLTTVSRLPAPYGTCEAEVDRNKTAYLYKGYEYSTEGCYRSCFQFALLEECGCGDPRLPLPPGGRRCGASDVVGRACIARKTAEFGGLHGGLDCVCNQPCMQKAYGVSFSCSRWPAETFRIRECELDTLEECVESYQKNGALIEVYYEQLNYEKLSESEAYGWVNLLADFGGQLGLWLGISVLTTIEFFVALYDFAKTFYHYDEDKIRKKESMAAVIMANRRPPSLTPKGESSSAASSRRDTVSTGCQSVANESSVSLGRVSLGKTPASSSSPSVEDLYPSGAVAEALRIAPKEKGVLMGGMSEMLMLGSALLGGDPSPAGAAEEEEAEWPFIDDPSRRPSLKQPSFRERARPHPRWMERKSSSPYAPWRFWADVDAVKMQEELDAQGEDWYEDEEEEDEDAMEIPIRGLSEVAEGKEGKEGGDGSAPVILNDQSDSSLHQPPSSHSHSQASLPSSSKAPAD